MKKILIFISFMILMTGGSIVFFSTSNQEIPKQELVKANDKAAEEQVEKDLKNEENKEEKVEESKVDSTKEVKKESSNQEIKENKTDTTVSEKNTNTKQEEVKKNESKEIVSEVESVPIIEAKKQEIWELLGMTEDQYYNQPLYSWERIDFASESECLDYGIHYEPAINGEVSFNCREITSPSGKYLGIMFDTEKLN